MLFITLLQRTALYYATFLGNGAGATERKHAFFSYIANIAPVAIISFFLKYSGDIHYMGNIYKTNVHLQHYRVTKKIASLIRVNYLGESSSKKFP